MYLLILVLSVVFLPPVFGYAPLCKPSTEPCIGLKCLNSQPFHYYQYSLLYGCCNGQVFDEKNYVCVSVNGKISLRSCNPCTQFRCGSGQCTLSSWRCNKVKDCKDGTDEVGCFPCNSYQYRCKNGRCISQSLVCDKKNQCGDGSDELGCIRKSGTSCGALNYRCANDRCIQGNWVCDNYNDCGDNSDEKGCTTFGKKRDEISDPSEEQDDQKEKQKEKDAEADTMS